MVEFAVSSLKMGCPPKKQRRDNGHRAYEWSRYFEHAAVTVYAKKLSLSKSKVGAKKVVISSITEVNKQ